ncbi:hypothetical protein EJ07DRAFT_160064 [Lizonia empirigonia]|nr:hypothetical protein EJ07DRAFT_160064 [Lizonia empirigonia]
MKSSQPATPESASSYTSKRGSSILGRAQAALSNLSRPVETWGMSDVPLLSPTQIVPRRTQPSARPALQSGDGEQAYNGSPRKLTHKRGTVATSRIKSLRPLSIASVSTFGAGMPDYCCADTNDAPDGNSMAGENGKATADHNGNSTAGDTGSSSQSPNDLPVQEPTPKTQPSAAVQHPHLCPPLEAPDYVQRRVGFRSNPRARLDPLRMHPPSPVASPVASPAPSPAPSPVFSPGTSPAHSLASSPIPSPAHSPVSSAVPSPVLSPQDPTSPTVEQDTPPQLLRPYDLRSRLRRLENDPAFEASLGCSPEWLARPVVNNLDVDAIINMTTKDNGEPSESPPVSNVEIDTSPTTSGDIRPPRDAGYVRALRKWYEEKEATAVGPQNPLRKLEKSRRL